ncbi:MAG: hypothetical protein ACHQ7N_13490 [Candidatus Methylomirabilales bacterium]
MMDRPSEPERTKVSAEELGQLMGAALPRPALELIKELEPFLAREQGYNPIIWRLARKMVGPTKVMVKLGIECLLFEWFLNDVVVAALFGPRADGIRQGMGDRILTNLYQSGLVSGDVSLDAFEDMRVKRFTEYLRALAGDKGTEHNWQALARVAWERMGGQPSLMAHVHLAGHASGMFNIYAEACSLYEITA